MQTLRQGSRGNDVAKLQQALGLLPDGIFGPLTAEAVRDFQKSHSLNVDGIAGPKTFAALGLSDNSTPILMKRSINMIILHCTATPEGKEYSVDTIRHWHVHDRGWKDIGYHYVIHLDGSIDEGRDINVIGAHCTGYNSHSIGIVYVGGYASDGKTPKDTRTPAQRKALRELVARLQRQFPGASVHGHYEFARKECPCFKIKDL